LLSVELLGGVWAAFDLFEAFVLKGDCSLFVATFWLVAG
jgi:hypothetical protein